MTRPTTGIPANPVAAAREAGAVSTHNGGAGGAPMFIDENPPAGWDGRITAPCQRQGFAEAMRTMGYRPLYLWNDRGAGVALVRGWLPGMRTLTARANLFAPGVDPHFASEALRGLAGWGVPYVKVGDTMWGLDWGDLPDHWPFAHSRVVLRHTFRLDLTRDLEFLFKNLDVSVRTSVRKAERESVEVREAASPDDLAAYCRLAEETTDRARRASAYTAFPAAFFQALYVRMGPCGAARTYVAWVRDVPLAACIVLFSKDQALYFAGASTRDREWTGLQGSTAALWHAIREAKRLGMTRFDFGGCTPTEDKSDPRHGVYAFKKRWGGQLEGFYNLEVVLGPVRHYVQDRVLLPLWDRVHPLYFRWLRAGRVR